MAEPNASSSSAAVDKMLIDSWRDRNAAINKAFDELDLDGNGEFDRNEILVFLEGVLKSMNLALDKDIMDTAVDALIRDAVVASSDGKSEDFSGQMDTITREQFANIFRRHPDMLKVFDDVPKKRISSVGVPEWDGMTIEEVKELVAQEVEEVRVRAKTHWKNRHVDIFWLCMLSNENNLDTDEADMDTGDDRRRTDGDEMLKILDEGDVEMLKRIDEGDVDNDSADDGNTVRKDNCMVSTRTYRDVVIGR